MTTMSVIPNFNVLKNSRTRGRPGGPWLPFKQLPTERREKAFGDRIVVTVGTPAHAGYQLVRGQQLAVIGGGILRSTIGMVQQPCPRPSALQGHPQSGQAQFGVQG